MAGLIRGKDRRVCGQWEMNTGEPIFKKSDKVITVRVEASGGGMDDLKKTHGTKLVWNSFKSTFKLPSKRREAVMLETTCAISLFKLVKVGAWTLSFFLQME